jgi:hypothetical protein
MNKIFLCTIMISFISSFKLLKIDRGLEKYGLHRLLVTNITFRADKIQEIFGENSTSLVFKEIITNETYIYKEELEKLNGFDFHPHDLIDIEKPASVSKNHTIYWRLPLNETLHLNDYIKYSKVGDQEVFLKN